MLKYILGLCLLFTPILSYASPEQVWQEGMLLAQQGQDKEAIALLRGAGLHQKGMVTPSVWTQRFDVAARLLQLRRDAKFNSVYNGILLSGHNQHEMLMQGWLERNPMPQASDSMVPSFLSSIIPGAGHAWLGRWGDAGVAAMLVWPLLILTFWAARRDMGPVTVFFALITAWLWSGTVFSATSLAERGDFELYYAWWQEMWIASGLPSRPW